MKELWRPTRDQVLNSQMYKFAEFAAGFGYQGAADDFHSLYDWSVSETAKFWGAVWQFGRIIHSAPYTEVFVKQEQVPWTKWFPGARLNFAENLLRERGSKPAIISWGEDKIRSELTFKELYRKVARAQTGLKVLGVKSGDTVVGFLPNTEYSIIAFLAAASIGATWSSCATEFEAKAVLSRFDQVSPKVLFTVDSYVYKGKTIDITAKVREIAAKLPTLEKVVFVPYLEKQAKVPTDIALAVSYEEFANNYAAECSFEQLPANHPIYILFSSGTTGKPKGIVHGAGGVLIKHTAEHMLHSNISEKDRFFYQTTCGWMMWNWQVSALARGATICLYDGFPFLNQGKILWDLAEKEKATIFGTNATFLSLAEKNGVKADADKIKNLRLILSTGSVLAPESYDYVYRDIKKDVCLSSFSGGTDIVGLFFDSNPMLPVYRDQLQCCSLGMKVEAFDQDGKAVLNEKGSLVCQIPFPSMPLRFVNDADGKKYFEAYFNRFPGVWYHGDLIQLHANGGITMYGREDSVLNKNGVRIGTAELYNPLQEIAEITGAIAVVHQKIGADKILLFVKMKEGIELSETIKNKITQTILRETSPWHKPDLIIAAPDLPITRSGKLAEIFVRDIINGMPLKSAEGLANEECLKFFHTIQP
jgi:acetoacetyl-CoA synthetase